MSSAPLPWLGAFALLCGVGCSVPADPVDAGDPQGLFPHEAAFAEPGHHGALVLAGKLELCQQCHDPASAAPAEEATIPGCRSCHAVYPHVEGWRSPEGHGQAFLAQPELPVPSDRSACTACHGELLRGGNAGVGCHDCHAAFPHDEGWAEPTGHGAFVASRGTTDACFSCHEAGDAASVEGDLTCRGCHPLFPHVEGWREPDHHGVAFLDPDGACGGCHGADWAGGPMAPACATCHPPFPHGDGWLTEHLGVVDDGGPWACLGCHEAGDGASTMPAACGLPCHGEGAP